MLATRRRLLRVGGGTGVGAGAADGKENVPESSPEMRLPHTPPSSFSSQSSSASSSPAESWPLSATADPAPKVTMRKELADANAGRAEMEMEYMNLLSTIESEKRATDDLLSARTRERDNLLSAAEELRGEVAELRSRVANEREEHRKEADQLRDDLKGKAAVVAEKERQLKEARTAAAAATASQKAAAERPSPPLPLPPPPPPPPSQVSSSDAALLRKEVEGAMRRLDEETRRFKTETEALRRERDEARRWAQQEGEEASRSKEVIKGLRSELADRTTEIETLKAALKESTESSAAAKEAAALRVQVEAALKTLDAETARFKEEAEALRAQKDEAEKLVRKEEAASARCQSDLADVQARLVVKDREIESLRGSLATIREHGEALEGEASELRRRVEDESERADNLKKEMQAVQMARSLARGSGGGSPPSLSFEKTLERDRRQAADQEQIDRLATAVAVKDAALTEKDAEIEELKSALQDSIDQSEVLIGEVRRLRSVGGGGSVCSDAESERRRRQDTELREMKDRVAESDATIEELENRVAEANVRNGRLEAELEDLRAQLDACASGGDEGMLVFERRRADDLQVQLEKKREENQSLKQDLEELCESMKDLAMARREEMDEVQSQISRTSTELGSKEREIRNLKAALAEEQSKHRFQLDWYEAKLRTLELRPEQESQRKEQIEELRRNNNYLRSQLATQTIETDKLRGRIESLSHSGGSLQELSALRSRNETLKKELTKWKRRYDGLESSIKRVSV